MNKLVFPHGFLWGSATSAHQIEGNNVNSDWWHWEHSQKRETELRNQNKNPHDYYSGVACDSYNRYKEDFDIAQKLNQNAHRFSIEWSRIQPKKGEFYPQEIAHYKAVLAELRARNIKTFVTLHHYTVPLWFEQLGGFTKVQNVKYFVEFAKKVISDLRENIDFVCVINEPNIYADLAFRQGKRPPQVRSIMLMADVLINLSEAHKQVYEAIKSVAPEIQVGTAQAVWDIAPEGLLKIFKGVVEKVAYEKYFDGLRKHSDFIGIQYYRPTRFRMAKKYPFIRNFQKKENISDLGWEVYPEGLLNVLRGLKKYDLPIFITENGIADSSDSKRKEFIHGHLKAIHQAISEKIDVRGYLHWSLMDNFEWTDGFEPRFGLVEIDRENNLQRKIRPSALYYAEICKTNSMEPA